MLLFLYNLRTYVQHGHNCYLCLIGKKCLRTGTWSPENSFQSSFMLASHSNASLELSPTPYGELPRLGMPFFEDGVGSVEAVRSGGFLRREPQF